MAKEYEWNMKTIMFGIVLTIGIIGIFYVAGGGLFVSTTENLASGCGGYKVLSLSSIAYHFSDPQLGFESLEMLILHDGSSNECAFGAFSDSEINQKLPGDRDVQYDFAVRTELTDQKIEYIIRDRADTITRLDYERDPCDTTVTCHLVNNCCTTFQQTARNKANFVDDSIRCYDIFGQNCDYTAYFSDIRGREGEIIGNAQYTFPVNIRIVNELGEELATTVLDGHETQSAYLTDANDRVRAFAKWDGFIAGTVDEPDVSNYMAIWDTEHGGWIINYRDEWLDWRNYRNSGFSSCITNAELGNILDYVLELDRCMIEWNSLEAELFSQNIIPWGWVGEYDMDVSGESSEGNLVFSAEKQIRYPLLHLHIDADWIGIYSPVGEPEITNVNPETLSFESGSGTTTATVKNVGEGAGVFTTYAECSSGFFPSTDTRTYSIGQSQSVPIRISAECAQQRTGTCTIKVKDDTAIYTDQWSNPISVTCEPPPQCDIEGFKRCAPDLLSVQICRGGDWELDQDCELGCHLVGGSPVCRTADCTSHRDCDDGDPSTIDKCIADIFGNYHCDYTPIPNVCVCGNQLCEPQCGETYINCQIDCGLCGNGLCQPELGENYYSCAVDCPQVCGNNICEAGETPENCPEDCIPPGPNLNTWMLIIMSFASVGLIVMALVRSRRGKGIPKK